MKERFPENFYWGSATSAHQVEGGNRNDWSEWEKANADRLAKEAERKFGYLSRWPDIKKQAQNPQNYISGRACEHYSRYEEDFDIAKSLGHNAHRFSIEWSRIEPEEGKWDEKEIEHYRSVIRALRSRGLEPFVTLWHWTIPLWLRDKGGVKSKKFPKYFSIYAERIVKELPNVKFWITLNEPEIYSAQSYLKGIWPPQKKCLYSYLRTFMNLIWAHRKAYRAIKKISPDAQVGIAKNNIYFEAYQNKPANYFLKKCADFWWNNLFLYKIWFCLDFIGLNHYFHNRIDYGFNKNENKKISDMGWELYPEGIYHVLNDLKKYGKPIYITENGLADARDVNREWYIKETLSNVHKAIREGVDARGYFYWSLLDNFEWDKGFWPRFGLVEINYKTMERKIRHSARVYAEICRNNTI